MLRQIAERSLRHVAGAVLALLRRFKLRKWEFCLESPRDNATVLGPLDVGGWVFHRGAAVEAVEISLDGQSPVVAPHRRARPDVAAAYPHDNVGLPGFTARLRIASAGRLALKVRVVCTDGSMLLLHRVVHRPSGSLTTAGLTLQEQGPSTGRVDPVTSALAREIEHWEFQVGRPLSLLDWTRSRRLRTGLPAATVFSPMSIADDRLPHLDRSVDIVAIDAGDHKRQAEAQRVALTKVISLTDTHWLEQPLSAKTSSSHKVSIVIPVCGRWDLTRACLEQIWLTAPVELATEVIVVDDASPDDTGEQLRRIAATEPRLRVVQRPSNMGFSHACNAGAAVATGDILVFLNNDTLPQAGWLPPLLEVLDRVGDAGAVGARLVSIDGTLQESGGVVFSDGSAWNLGRGAHPDDPLFARLRPVDYCSAAALATKTALFQQLGGFDTRYAPAYYEDTDFCFALRAKGHEVYVQPLSTVVHLEGGTAGIDESRGIKRHQATNRQRFAEKWTAELRSQPVAPPAPTRETLRHLSTRRGERAPRVLVVAPTSAEFDRESGSRRVFQMLQLFRSFGWEVVFVANHESPEIRYVGALQRLGIEAWAGPDSSAPSARNLRELPALLLETRFNLAVLHFWQVAEQYLPAIRRFAPNTPVAVDSVDLHLLRNFRTRFANRELLSAGDGEQAVRELNVYASADCVLTVSAKEAALIDDFVGTPGHAQVLPDFEDLERSARPVDERTGILFIGNFRHLPNVEAVTWLFQEIVPLLDPKLLDLHPLTVVGNDLTPDLIKRCGGDRPGINWVGWVPQIEPYLDKARLVLAPLRTGAGTKRKLLQALMMGTPIVTTSIGAEGLDLVADEHVLIADNARDLAVSTERLATDDALWSSLATAGRAHVGARHGPQSVRAPFERLLAMCKP